MDSISLSEPVSIYAAFHELDDSLDSGERAFTHDQVELGVSRGAWSVALIARYDYFLRFHSDTAELAHRGENGLPLDPGRRYVVKASVNHARSYGVRVGYRFEPLESVQLHLAASYLQANQLLDGKANGVIQIDDDEYSGHVDIDYSYTEDLLLDRRAREPEGQGYAVDAHLRWRASDRLTLDLSVEDLASAIYWSEAPFTRATVTSSTLNLDEDGFLDTTPVLSGVEAYHDLKQELPRRTRLGARFRMHPRIELAASNLNVDGFDLPSMGIALLGKADKRLMLSYLPKLGGVKLGFDSDWLTVAIGLDEASFSRAHFLDVSATLRLAL